MMTACLELLDLLPPWLGVARAGIYVIDDDGIGVLAGPFADLPEALAWIARTQPARRAAARAAPNRPGTGA